jgi:hypothetical protein
MKKLALICLVLIIATGFAGMAYARWSSTLTIAGTVQTGTFDVVFDAFNSPGNSNGATFSAPKTDNHNYTITLNNLYPGLDATFDFTLKNTGTVPARIKDIKIDGNSVVGANYKLDKDLSPADSLKDITITIQNITTATTLGAGSSISGHIKVHTWSSAIDANDATPNASGSFTIEIDTQQET